MARVTIPWAVGGGNIYLDFDEASGTQTVLVSSDANNTYAARSQSVTFRATVSPNPTATLTVRQNPKGGSFDHSFDLSFTINT